MGDLTYFKEVCKLKTRAFQKSYQNKCVLSFPDFRFEPGKIYAVIGSNGSGKSTFAKILSDILPADKQISPFEDGKPTVGYLPQKPYAFRMSLKKNLLINTYGDKKAAGEQADSLINKLELNSLSGKNATTLSGGEAARMFLARLLMKQYDLLILDEPCAAMDISSTLISEELLVEYMKKSNASVIIITHNLQQARRISDEVLFFHKGNLLETGETSRVLSHPIHKETQLFLDFFHKI